MVNSEVVVMTIGEKIHELRKVNRISQEKIAEMLNVSRQAVSKWETGQSFPTTENLISLAQIFNVPVEQLAHPNTRVELVMEVKKEVNTMKKTSKLLPISIGIFLLLFIGTFVAALYGRIGGAYDEKTVLILVLVSVGFMLMAFVPILVTILRLVYKDCKRRGIKPTFWVLISTTMIGLVYYFLKRDYLSNSNLQ